VDEEMVVAVVCIHVGPRDPERMAAVLQDTILAATSIEHHAQPARMGHLGRVFAYAHQFRHQRGIAVIV